MKKALIIWGGWDGHEPEVTAKKFAAALADKDFEVRLETSLTVLEDHEALKALDLIIPVYSMGSITKEQCEGLKAAVESGVGLAGTHGGMVDAFRGNIAYEWIAGGVFVGHPHIGEYTVTLNEKGKSNELTKALPASFSYNSEQYYMLVDPANEVLAETTYEHDGKTCAMPVIWIRKAGKGKVFFSALGHVPAEFDAYPHVFDMTIRGMVWAAK